MGGGGFLLSLSGGFGPTDAQQTTVVSVIVFQGVEGGLGQSLLSEKYLVSEGNEGSNESLVDTLHSDDFNEKILEILNLMFNLHAFFYNLTHKIFKLGFML